MRTRAAISVFPVWMKYTATLVAACWLSVYWGQGEPEGFVWFFDFALLVMVAALWFESRLLASMAALALLMPEAAWNVGLLSHLLGTEDVFGFAAYMFDSSVPTAVRVVSMAHLALAPMIVWMVLRLRYDRRAFVVQTLCAWMVLGLSYLLAHAPVSDISWSLGVGDNLAHAWLPGWVWLLLSMFAYPTLVYLPTHFVLLAFFSDAGRASVLGKAKRRDAPYDAPRELTPFQARLRALTLFDLALWRRRR